VFLGFYIKAKRD